MSAQDPKANNPKIEQAAASDQNIQKVHAILLREKPEPAEGYSPMPLFLLGFVSAMIFIVSVYFVHNRGGIGPNLKTGVSGLSFKEAALVYDERYDPAKAPGAGAVKAGAGEGGDVQRHQRRALEEGDAVCDDADNGRSGGADGGRVIDAEQHAHFADEGAGLDDGRDLDAVALDHEAAFFEDVELAAGFAFFDEGVARCELAAGLAGDEGEDRRHAQWFSPDSVDMRRPKMPGCSCGLPFCASTRSAEVASSRWLSSIATRRATSGWRSR